MEQIKIAIVSLKDASLTPQVRNVDLTAGRPTEQIGNAVRSLIQTCSNAYKKPALRVYVGQEMVGEFSPKGSTFAEKVRSVNFGITEIVLNSRFSTDELTFNKNSKDEIALGISKAFGFKGASVCVDVAAKNLKAVEKAAKAITKYATIDANGLYQSLVGPEILAAIAQDKEERKLLTASK